MFSLPCIYFSARNDQQKTKWHLRFFQKEEQKPPAELKMPLLLFVQLSDPGKLRCLPLQRSRKTTITIEMTSETQLASLQDWLTQELSSPCYTFSSSWSFSCSFLRRLAPRLEHCCQVGLTYGSQLSIAYPIQ